MNVFSEGVSHYLHGRRGARSWSLGCYAIVASAIVSAFFFESCSRTPASVYAYQVQNDMQAVSQSTTRFSQLMMKPHPSDSVWTSQVSSELAALRAIYDDASRRTVPAGYESWNTNYLTILKRQLSADERMVRAAQMGCPYVAKAGCEGAIQELNQVTADVRALTPPMPSSR